MNELKHIVDSAVNDFLKETPNLLELNVHEQSISHRIAVHIEKRLHNNMLNVDCEYNKNLGQPKLIEVDGLGWHERSSCGCHVCLNNNIEDLERERAFRPDIIVHKRNSNAHNKIAVEVKRHKFCPFDEAKLKALTGNRNGYNYSIGVFVYFPAGKPIYIWYCKGSKIDI